MMKVIVTAALLIATAPRAVQHNAGDRSVHRRTAGVAPAAATRSELVEREVVQYAILTEAARASMRTISESLSSGRSSEAGARSGSASASITPQDYRLPACVDKLLGLSGLRFSHRDTRSLCAESPVQTEQWCCWLCRQLIIF
jgi:hypothetical protein